MLLAICYLLLVIGYWLPLTDSVKRRTSNNSNSPRSRPSLRASAVASAGAFSRRPNKQSPKYHVCRVNPERLKLAIDAVPPGPWAIGVSGGADSVALLELLRGRSDLALHVVHLDHEARGKESAADAEFVRALAAQWNLRCTIARLRDVEDDAIRGEANVAARFRAARLSLFQRVVKSHALQGVILAHHADDQAETVLQRLLRGSGPAGLGGMTCDTTIGPLRVLRPLLGLRKSELQSLLAGRKISWREDPGNALPIAQRNRVRIFLADRPELVATLLELSEKCRAMTMCVREAAPALQECFTTDQLANLPGILARESARKWLADRAGPSAEITPAAIDRLIAMATDAATSPRQDFPGQLRVCRKSKMISAMAREHRS